MNEAAKLIAERGDLAHLVLFLWATSVSGILLWVMRELMSSNRRFNEFVTEIAKLNRLFDV